jgi:RNA polymerase sigma-70 factor (ECF subfamily)
MDRSAAEIARRIGLAREGRPSALDELLAAYRNYVRLLASTSLRRDLRAKADPSDVVQETLLKAHQHFHEFRGTTEREWIAWVRQILVRTLANFHRSFAAQGRAAAREQSLESELERSSEMLSRLALAPGPSPSKEAQRRELGVLVADALEQLEDADREVVVLRNLEELGWAEIAERMERTPDAARMHWARALRRIAGLLGEEGS